MEIITTPFPCRKQISDGMAPSMHSELVFFYRVLLPVKLWMTQAESMSWPEVNLRSVGKTWEPGSKGWWGCPPRRSTEQRFADSSVFHHNPVVWFSGYLFLLSFLHHNGCSGQHDDAPKCPHPNPWSLWTCRFTGQNNSAYAVQVRSLQWGDYPGLSEGTQWNHKGP